jgi:hypothetical protein
LIGVCLAKLPTDRFGRGLEIARFARDRGGFKIDLSGYGLLRGNTRAALLTDTPLLRTKRVSSVRVTSITGI